MTEEGKKRVMQLSHDTADLMKDLLDRMTELSVELDVPAKEILALVNEHIPEDSPMRFPLYRVWSWMFPVAAGADGEPMQQTIARLFEGAPKLRSVSGKADASQSPAVEVAGVLLKSGGQFPPGSLSITPEGLLRLGNIRRTEDGKTLLVETTFEYDSVEAVLTMKQVELAGSRIVPASH